MHSDNKKMSAGPPDCKVYVGNLPSGASRTELENAFSYYGPIKNVWVARNPPGFAFVLFEDSRDARDAVRYLDDRIICGVRVRVEMTGERRKPRNVVPISDRGIEELIAVPPGGVKVNGRCCCCAASCHSTRDRQRRDRGSERGRSRSRSWSRSRSRSQSRSPRRKSQKKSPHGYSRSPKRSPRGYSRSPKRSPHRYSHSSQNSPPRSSRGHRRARSHRRSYSRKRSWSRSRSRSYSSSHRSRSHSSRSRSRSSSYSRS